MIIGVGGENEVVPFPDFIMLTAELHTEPAHQGLEKKSPGPGNGFRRNRGPGLKDEFSNEEIRPKFGERKDAVFTPWVFILKEILTGSAILGPVQDRTLGLK